MSHVVWPIKVFCLDPNKCCICPVAPLNYYLLYSFCTLNFHPFIRIERLKCGSSSVASLHCASCLTGRWETQRGIRNKPPKKRLASFFSPKKLRQRHNQTNINRLHRLFRNRTLINDRFSHNGIDYLTKESNYL